MYKILALPCVHLDLVIRPVYGLVKRFIKHYKPDEIIILGDFANCTSLSHWEMEKKRKIEGKRYAKEIIVANKELDFLQGCAKKVTYIEGNHENWVEQYIDHHPEMECLIELPTQLRLKERGIEWIPMNDLYCVGKRAKVYFTHGMWVTMHHAKKHLQKLGCNIVYAHSHSAQTHLMNQKMQEPYMAYGLGWLGDIRETKYLRNKHTNWIHQFATIETEPDMFNVTPINIVNNKFIHNGRVWK